MRIAKRAALVMAMTSFLALAQQRKPSPGTSVVSAPSSSPSATHASPALQPAVNSYRRNSAGTVSQVAPQPITARPAVPAPIVRSMPPIPAPQVAPQSGPASIAASMVPASVAPAVTPAPPSEPTAAVNYAQGQLTVVSQSASLGTVLKLISARTGAVIDLAPELQNEPVVAQIGPSTVREVMTALLDSPKIDYIIMGSGNASGGLERVLVRTRQSFGRNAIAMNRAEPSAPAVPELRFNANGSSAVGVAKPQTALTQEQLMENWKKIREEKKQAEIAQQQQDRENEANNVEPPPPQPENQPEPQPTNAVPDNPPLK